MQLQWSMQQRAAQRCQQQHVAHRRLAICRAAIAADARTTKKQLAFPFVRIQGQEEVCATVGLHGVVAAAAVVVARGATTAPPPEACVLCI
jgi:hypothetical protein